MSCATCICRIVQAAAHLPVTEDVADLVVGALGQSDELVGEDRLQLGYDNQGRNSGARPNQDYEWRMAEG